MRQLIAILFAALTVAAASEPALGNYLGRGPQQPAPEVLILPGPLEPFAAWVMSMQRELNAELRQLVAAAKDAQTSGPAWAIIGLSFLYGIFHAAGPGHGKVVVGTYFATQRARIAQGFAMSGAVALVQAITAIAAIGGLGLIIDLGARDIMRQTALLETASYALIVGMGMVIAWNVFKGRECCDHAHEPGHVHNHDHGHGHGHHHDSQAKLLSRSQILASVGVGLRPCTGALIVLLFTMANGMFALGVAATFAMAVGVAITVSAVSLGGLGIQRLTERLGAGGYRLAHRAIGFGGAAVISLFGLTLLIASLPQAGAALGF